MKNAHEKNHPDTKRLCGLLRTIFMSTERRAHRLYVLPTRQLEKESSEITAITRLICFLARRAFHFLEVRKKT